MLVVPYSTHEGLAHTLLVAIPTGGHAGRQAEMREQLLRVGVAEKSGVLRIFKV